MTTKLEVTYEATPNPETYKFNINQRISEESVDFTDPNMSSRSPLAHKLFGFPWAESVFIGPTFVSVTKQSWVEWNILADPLSQLIKEHLENGDPVLLPPQDESFVEEEDSDVVTQIKKVIEYEIRPAVAMDGGDIVFSSYQNNIVYIHMRGACSGCPSATATLKNGIEVRLKEVIPEIKEVIAL
ncbi:MAG: NifU family protein [Bdellovibrionales bacterium]|nr:NifU family protein [Bdellovibrionales bacterium]